MGAMAVIPGEAHLMEAETAAALVTEAAVAVVEAGPGKKMPKIQRKNRMSC